MTSGVLASEWLKLRSIRSTYCILGAIGLTLLLSAFLTWRAVRGLDQSAGQEAGNHPLHMKQILPPFVQYSMAVLGALSITTEHATGTIRASLVCVPSRLRLLTGKACIVAATALVVAVLTTIASDLVATAIISGHAAPVASPSFYVPGFLALGVSAAVMALVGLGVGAALPSAAGATVAVTVILFLPSMLAQHLPQPWSAWLASVALSNLPAQLAPSPASEGPLSPLAALAVMTAYAMSALVAGAVALHAER